LIANLSRWDRRGAMRQLTDLHPYPWLRENHFWGPGIKRLKNWQPPTWRYRVGYWRFFNEVDEAHRTVFKTVADHLKQAYR